MSTVDLIKSKRASIESITKNVFEVSPPVVDTNARARIVNVALTAFSCLSILIIFFKDLIKNG